MVEFIFLGLKITKIRTKGGSMRGNIKSAVTYLQKIMIAVGLILAFTQSVYAVDLNSAVGFWVTKDAKTNQDSSIVQIWQDKTNHRYYGKIYKIFPENGHKVSDVCVACKGKQQGQPMLGLQIIRDMVFSDGQYHDGHILDPRDGKEYHAKMTVVDDGEKLKLRGYIGLPLFGKTTEWARAPKNLI